MADKAKDTVSVKDKEIEDQKIADKELADHMEILRQAEELGISVEGLTDKQIIFKVITEFNKANAQLATALATNETKSVKQYLLGVDTKLKDQEFITRLMNMSVPNFYLHLFEDSDKAKTDRELWTMVNKSGINPFVSFESLLNSSKKYAKVKRRDQ